MLNANAVLEPLQGRTENCHQRYECGMHGVITMDSKRREFFHGMIVEFINYIDLYLLKLSTICNP